MLRSEKLDSLKENKEEFEKQYKNISVIQIKGNEIPFEGSYFNNEEVDVVVNNVIYLLT